MADTRQPPHVVFVVVNDRGDVLTSTSYEAGLPGTLVALSWHHHGPFRVFRYERGEEWRGSDRG